MERILCAAIRRLNRRECKSTPYWEGTNDILEIEIGYRHHDIFMRFMGEVSKNPYDQGFYTSLGRYVDRYEGMKIAKDAGQVPQSRGLRTPESEATLKELDNVSTVETKEPNTFESQYYPLFSEDLY